jgi:hypothetical protein
LVIADTLWLTPLAFNRLPERGTRTLVIGDNFLAIPFRQFLGGQSNALVRPFNRTACIQISRYGDIKSRVFWLNTMAAECNADRCLCRHLSTSLHRRPASHARREHRGCEIASPGPMKLQCFDSR